MKKSGSGPPTMRIRHDANHLIRERMGKLYHAARRLQSLQMILKMHRFAAFCPYRFVYRERILHFPLCHRKHSHRFINDYSVSNGAFHTADDTLKKALRKDSFIFEDFSWLGAVWRTYYTPLLHHLNDSGCTVIANLHPPLQI